MDNHHSDDGTREGTSPEQMKVFQYKNGALYVLMPDGADPCCGVMCGCHSKGVQCMAESGVVPEELKEANTSVHDFDDMVSKVNAILASTVIPPCPCMLTIVGIFFMKAMYIRRRNKIVEVLDTINQSLMSGRFEWKYYPCENGETFVIALHSKDSNRTKEIAAENVKKGLTVNKEQEQALEKRAMVMSRLGAKPTGPAGGQ